MQQPDLNLQVRMLAETGKLSDLPSGERVSGVARLQPGQAVAARILAPLPDGRFTVRVQNRELAMALPAGVRAGQDIRLTYVGEDRQSNFMLLESPAADTMEAPAFSSAARLAAVLTQRTAAGEALPAPTAAAPILDAATADAPLIETRLRQAISTSGLFYESHQARWAAGEHPLELLMLEPQAHLSRASERPEPMPRTAEPADMTDRHPANVALLPLPPAGGKSDKEAGLPAHPETLPIIQHQLATLESGRIQWQGQLWPGQPMQWQVTEFRGGQEGQPGPDGWETSVGLTLAELGDVEARLRVQRGRITVNLSSDRADKAALMRANLDDLAMALEDAGLQVNSISVDRRDV